LADLPSPKRQTGRPARGDAHGAGSTEKIARRPTLARAAMCTGPSTGPAPAISADSVRTPLGSSRLQTASGFWAPSIATLATDAPSGETSTGRSQAPEAAARRADWTTPMPATVQTATALPGGAR